MIVVGVILFIGFEIMPVSYTHLLKQKAENGEYQGTKEEINAQMQSEFLNRSYELLELSLIHI